MRGLSFSPTRRPSDPPPRIGLVDLGTNTVLCSVLFGDAREPRALRIAEDLHFVTGLGQTRAADGALAGAGLGRAERSLRYIARRLHELGVAPSAVHGAATAACREAPNGPAFLRTVRQDLGLPLRVITGEEEAGFVGLAQARSFPAHRAQFVIDIGGGSTELALRVAGEQRWARSIPVGATKLGALFGPRPVIEEAREYVARAAADAQIPTDAARASSAVVIGVAGTVTTALQVLDRSEHWDPSTLHGRALERDEVEQLALAMLRASPQQRRALPGLHPLRADFLGPGLLWLCALLDVLGSQRLLVSDRGLRFGLLHTAYPTALVL